MYLNICLLQTGQVLGRVNVVSGHVKTQLIAHDKEVYDIAFSRAGGGRDMFASVGKISCAIHLCCVRVIMFWRKPDYLEKMTSLLQVTDKTLSHNVVSSTPRLSGVRTHNVSGDRH